MRSTARPRLMPLVASTVVVGAALLALTTAAQQPASIDRGRYLQHVKYLASDELQGRGNGSPGLEKAAEYIAARFKEAGLEPGGDDHTFFQTFEIVTGVDVGASNTLSITGPGGTADLRLGRDFYPLSIRLEGGGEPAGSVMPLVFAGYGISAPALAYDDFAGVEVTGKAVLVFAHEPQENDARSSFDGRSLTQHATFLNKAMAARQHGASLVIVVEDMTHAGERASYEGFLRDPQTEAFGLPLVRARRDVIQRLLGSALDLKQVHADIDADLKPRSRALPDVSVEFQEHYDRVRRPIRNVVGVLRGAGRPDEAVVVGAHYDHLGLGGRNSMSADAVGQVHNGADDNASGTAGVLEMARIAGATRPARTLVFAAFSGEEIGLLGSAHYANRPTVPLESTIAMINLDMIGRPNGRLLLSGFEYAPALEHDLEAARRVAGSTLEIRRFSEGADVGSSDDASFSARRIPAIAFFSGFHGDYHRPGDDWPKLDLAGAVEVTRLAWALTREIATRPERPEFVAPQTDPNAHSGGNVGSVGGYGPYFGTVPDFAQEGEGVRFAEIRDGSPASKAGLRAGDVLIAFDGVAMKTLYDFTYALRGKRPGDRVDVVVRRNGRELKVSVELGTRP